MSEQTTEAAAVVLLPAADRDATAPGNPPLFTVWQWRVVGAYSTCAAPIGGKR